MEAPPPGLDVDARRWRRRRQRRRGWVAGLSSCALAAALGAALAARAAAVTLPPLTNPLVPHPPAAPPPLSVQAADAAAYAAWARKDQYRYASVPIKVLPLYGTDYTHGKKGTVFYANLPVTWIITPLDAGSRTTRYTVLQETATELQLASAGKPGVWRITAAATSCLDTCAPNCAANTCTAQMGSPACSAEAAGAVGHVSKACDLAYFVVHFRVLALWQIVVAALLFLCGFIGCYALINGCDSGIPGLWQANDGTSWTVRQPAREAGLAPPTFVARTGNTRLRLDVEEGSGGARPVAKMYRSAAEQEKTLLL